MDSFTTYNMKEKDEIALHFGGGNDNGLKIVSQDFQNSKNIEEEERNTILKNDGDYPNFENIQPVEAIENNQVGRNYEDDLK